MVVGRQDIRRLVLSLATAAVLYIEHWKSCVSQLKVQVPWRSDSGDVVINGTGVVIFAVGLSPKDGNLQHVVTLFGGFDFTCKHRFTKHTELVALSVAILRSKPTLMAAGDHFGSPCSLSFSLFMI